MKVGDKVVYISGRFSIGTSNPLWDNFPGKVIGEIKAVDRANTDLPIFVIWSNGKRNGYREDDLLLYSKTKEAKLIKIKEILK